MTEIAGAKQNYQIKQRNNQLFQLFCTQLSKRNQRRLQKFDLELFSPNRENDADCSTLSKWNWIKFCWTTNVVGLDFLFDQAMKYALAAGASADDISELVAAAPEADPEAAGQLLVSLAKLFSTRAKLLFRCWISTKGHHNAKC